MKGSSDRIRSVLIKAPNWVGDNVFILPAVAEARKLFPGARFAVLVKKGIASLWGLVDGMDEIIPYEARGGLRDLSSKAALIRAIRGKRFDLALIFPRSLESAAWIFLAGIPRRWGYAEEGRSFLLTRIRTSPRGYRHTHRIDYYYRLVADVPDDSPAPLARLRAPPDLVSWARDELKRATGKADWKRLVGIHPRASHGPAKCWPLENYARLTSLLVKEDGCAVVVFGNAIEAELAGKVARAGGTRAFSLAGETNLQQLAALISLCRVFVANDTGPLHLAAALGVPVVGIFGSSDPAATAPRGERVRTIYKSIPCSPCLRRICPTDFRCMTEISVEEVLAALEELLGKDR